MSIANVTTSIMMANIFPTTTSGALKVYASGYTSALAIYIISYRFWREEPEMVVTWVGSVNETTYLTFSREMPGSRYNLIVPSAKTTGLKPTPLLIKLGTSANLLRFILRLTLIKLVGSEFTLASWLNLMMITCW